MNNQKFPEPIVGALIFNPINEILLVKSSKWNNLYVVPGGHVESGECLNEALKREIKEETALDIYEVEFAGVNEMIFDNVYWQKKHFIFINYTCKTNSREVSLNNEAQSSIWITLDDSVNLAVEPYTKQLINLIIERERLRQ